MASPLPWKYRKTQKSSIAHDYFNMICLDANIAGVEHTIEIVKVFLSASFSEDRGIHHRLEKIDLTVKEGRKL
jgi:ribose 5-phosphate isomerase RpiB